MEVQTDSERVRLVAQDGPRVPRLVGGPVDSPARRAGRGLAGMRALRRRPGALRAAGAAGRRRRARRRASPATTTPPTATRPPRPSPSRSRSTTTSTSATTRSASSATSASRPAASTPRTRSRSRSPGAASTPGSRPSANVAAARLGLRLLRQLHRRLPDRRADVQDRVRHARGRHLGRVAPDRDRHDLPVLRRRLHARRSTSRTTRSSR